MKQSVCLGGGVQRIRAQCMVLLHQSFGARSRLACRRPLPDSRPQHMLYAGARLHTARVGCALSVAVLLQHARVESECLRGLRFVQAGMLRVRVTATERVCESIATGELRRQLIGWHFCEVPPKAVPRRRSRSMHTNLISSPSSSRSSPRARGAFERPAATWDPLPRGCALRAFAVLPTR